MNVESRELSVTFEEELALRFIALGFTFEGPYLFKVVKDQDDIFVRLLTRGILVFLNGESHFIEDQIHRFEHRKQTRLKSRSHFLARVGVTLQALNL